MLRAPALCLLVLVFLLVAGCPSREVNSTRGPSFATETLPSGRVGTFYQVTLEIDGGGAPLTFDVGALPAGFSFYRSSGRLEGTPRVAGHFSLNFTVTDAWGRSAQQALVLEIGHATGERGDDVFLDIANWNILWFGDPEMGPYDERAQLRGVSKVIGEDGAQIWALVEVVDPGHFEALIDDLSATTGVEWEGLLASDPRVAGGAQVYGPGWLRPALIWQRDVLTVTSAEIILRDSWYDFGGRPPLKVSALAQVEGVSTPITFVVIHLKAFAEPEAHARRAASARALEHWLDAQPAHEEILVLGDWNDDLDASILIPWPSPFEQLVEHPRHVFLTWPLSFNGVSTMVFYSEPIDHQLATECLAQRSVPGFTVSTRPSIPSYGTLVSDHYPVKSRFRFHPAWSPCG